MKSARPEGYNKGVSSQRQKPFIEWSESPAFSVELKRKDSFERAIQVCATRTDDRVGRSLETIRVYRPITGFKHRTGSFAAKDGVRRGSVWLHGSVWVN